MLKAYAHAAMVDVYLSGQEGPETSWHSHETAGSEGFCHHPLHLPPLVRSENIQRLEHSLVVHHLHNCCNILKQRYLW